MKNEEEEMINEEKAYCLIQEHLGERIEYFQRKSVEKALLEMANWKDEQFAKEKQQLIEKACEWLRENKNKYVYNKGGHNEYIPTCSDQLVEDFIKYMKGK